MSKEIKDKRITFRVDTNEYERLELDALSTGSDLSTYIRKRVAGKVERVFYDPEMTQEMRSYRSEIRALVQEINRLKRENSNRPQELEEIKGIVKSIYHKMEDVEQCLLRHQKELMKNGDNEAA